MERITFIFIIGGALVSFYTLCRFIGLCNNVAKIRRALENNAAPVLEPAKEPATATEPATEPPAFVECEISPDAEPVYFGDAPAGYYNNNQTF